MFSVLIKNNVRHCQCLWIAIATSTFIHAHIHSEVRPQIVLALTKASEGRTMHSNQVTGPKQWSINDISPLRQEKANEVNNLNKTLRFEQKKASFRHWSAVSFNHGDVKSLRRVKNTIP